MPIAMWCVLIAGILPILTVGAAKWSDRSFDNARPRAWAAAAEGWRARLVAAQNNGFETFPLFAAAVLVAWTQGGPQLWIDRLAVAFVILRLAYVWAYATDRPSLRSALWAVGLLVTVAIFTASVWGGGPA